MARTSPAEFVQQVQQETRKVTWPSWKETYTTTTMTNTMRVVMRVSFQEGQVTLRVSCRTCWTNSVGLVLAMRCYPEGLVSSIDLIAASWQEWRGSNPQPPVLETGALPIELHS